MKLNVYTTAVPKPRLSAQLLLSMKLTIIFCIIFIINAGAKGYSQRINLNEGNTSLKQVFRAIEQQTPYVFFYDNNDIKKAKINITVKDGSIEETLNECFKNLPLTYSIVEKNIVVSRKDENKTNDANQVASRKIQGKITDTTGATLPGVNVSIKGTNIGAASDKNGNYTIDVPNDQAVLVFSFIGYATQEIKVGDKTNLNVTLRASQRGLNEIVIVGYGTQSKAKLTGAISTVQVDDILRDRPVSTLSTLLINVVPGLQITVPSGQPGSSTSLNIRGGTDISTTGNAVNTGSPLILVDNVPFNGPLNLINPSDIETISVLKDAGSAAIYGGRSAFGVILITTKKGRKNQPVQFDYNNNITFANAVNLPVKATALQFLQSLKDMGTTTYYTGNDVATWSQLENEYIADPGKYPGGITYVNGLGYQLAPTNVQNDLLGSNVPQFQNNLSVSGGSDKTTFRLALGSVNDNGIIDPSSHYDNFKKYTVSSMISTDVNKWLTTQLSANYYNSKTTTPNNNEFGIAENFPVLTPDSYNITSTTGVVGTSATPKNLVSLGAPNISQTGDTRLTGRAIVKPFTGLTLTGEYTYDGLTNTQNNYSELLQLINPQTYVSSPYGTGTYQIINDQTSSKSLNIYGNYVKSFGDNNFSLLGGYNQENLVSSDSYVQRNGMIAGALPSISLGTGPIIAGDGAIPGTNYPGYTGNTLQGYFGRFNYDYKGKYLLQLGGRYDGSSNFPVNHRFGFFPSGELGWRVIDEDFMKTLKPVLSELKLRASVGSVGNQNIGPYSFIPVLNQAQPYWLNGGGYVTTLTPPAIISSNFTWEKVQTFDYGIDFGLFNNHLTGSFDYYIRNTDDILAAGATPLPAVLGTGAPLENTASLSAKGYEIQLNWHDKIGQVKYHIGVNLYDSQSTITKFEGNPSGLLNTYYVGEKAGQIWGYVTDRLYTANDFVAGSLNSSLTGGKLKPGIPAFQGELPNPGDVLFKDLNGDGVINPGNGTLSNPGDQKVIGNSTPRYQFGANGDVAYKSFVFSFALSGVGKEDLNLINALTVPNNYPFATLYQGELNYWTPTNLNAHFGRIYNQAAGNQGTNQITQTSLLLNGAYLRINNLALSYSLPTAFVNRLHLNSFRVFCSVENPFLFDHLPKGIDPSLANQSYGLQYPFLRQTSFGVNVAF